MPKVIESLKNLRQNPNMVQKFDFIYHGIAPALRLLDHLRRRFSSDEEYLRAWYNECAYGNVAHVL